MYFWWWQVRWEYGHIQRGIFRLVSITEINTGFRPQSNFLCGSVSGRYTYANWIVTTNVRELPTAASRQELVNQYGGCMRMRVSMKCV